MPEPLLVTGAMLRCSMGGAPTALIVLPDTQVTAGGAAVGTVVDMTPVQSIPSFGMCSSLSNPQVASATSAAGGTLTPQPCLPNVAVPWKPGLPLVLVAGQPAINRTCTCQCTYGGVISVQTPGQETVLG